MDSNLQCRLALHEKGRVGGPTKLTSILARSRTERGVPLGTSVRLDLRQKFCALALSVLTPKPLGSARSRLTLWVPLDTEVRSDCCLPQNDFLPLLRSFHGRVDHDGDRPCGLSPGVQWLERGTVPREIHKLMWASLAPSGPLGPCALEREMTLVISQKLKRKETREDPTRSHVSTSPFSEQPCAVTSGNLVPGPKVIHGSLLVKPSERHFVIRERATGVQQRKDEKTGADQYL